MSAQDWTEERVVLLKTMKAQGKSASEIARLLRATGFASATRNSVIGKVIRLGLAGGGGSVSKARHAAAKEMARRINDRRRATRQPAPKLEPITIITTSDPLAPVLFDGKTIGVTELAPSMCKYPIGDPADPSFAFCARESSVGPYCADHAKLCYQPLEKAGKRAA